VQDFALEKYIVIWKNNEKGIAFSTDISYYVNANDVFSPLYLEVTIWKIEEDHSGGTIPGWH